jgi:pimeloyl-ACP methyl ester carboxylesterase
LCVWQGGTGPHLIVLPGLVRSAAVVARGMTRAHPGWAVTVIEPPGVGGSSRIDPVSPEQLASVINEALSVLGVADAALVADDLCAPIGLALAVLRGGRFRLVLTGQSLARGWVRRGVRPPPLDLRRRNPSRGAVGALSRSVHA